MAQKNGHKRDSLNFITPKFMEVLDLFLEEPMQEFHEREVVRKTRVSKGSVNKILRTLANMNMLMREKKGRMVFYKLNWEDPVVRQFKILRNVYPLRGVVNELKSNSKKIVLFGSCAQGSDVKSSDIDLFILTSEKDQVRKKIGVFNRKAVRKIAPIVVNSNEFVKLKHEDKALYDNIDRGIVLWQAE